jgi:hypothetical protein
MLTEHETALAGDIHLQAGGLQSGLGLKEHHIGPEEFP